MLAWLLCACLNSYLFVCLFTWWVGGAISEGDEFGDTFADESVTSAVGVGADLDCTHAREVVVDSIADVLAVCGGIIDFRVDDAGEHLAIEGDGLLSEDLWVANVAFRELLEGVWVLCLLEDFLDLGCTGGHGASDGVFRIDDFTVDVGFGDCALDFGSSTGSCRFR